MIYYSEIVNNKLIMFTTSEKVAVLQGWEKNKVNNTEVEQGYDGAFYLKGYAPQKGLSELKSGKISEIKSFHDACVNNLLQDYSQSEISSFYKQEAEATKYILHKEANGIPTTEYMQLHYPFLYTTALSRGMDFDLLATKVVEASASFVGMQGLLMGAKQRCEDMLKASSTVADVEAIDVVAIFAGILAQIGYTVDADGDVKPL